MRERALIPGFIVFILLFIYFFVESNRSSDHLHKPNSYKITNHMGQCDVYLHPEGIMNFHVSAGSASFNTKFLSDPHAFLSIENLWICDSATKPAGLQPVLDKYIDRLRHAFMISNIAAHEIINQSNIAPFDVEFDIHTPSVSDENKFWGRDTILKSPMSHSHPSTALICEYGSTIVSPHCKMSISPSCFPGLIFTINGLETGIRQKAAEVRDALDNLASSLIENQECGSRKVLP